jgi:organic hydroperoxide reductase OsmC/OhrA
MEKSHPEHHYNVTIEWKGNLGPGTKSYIGYKRDHAINSGSKHEILGSSDPAFRGDASRWNPEDLLVAGLSACHKLWYLHVCVVAGITVHEYIDNATGTMVEDAASGGHFTRVLLRPKVTVSKDDDVDLARRLHHDAHAKCFLANSVNFPVDHEPTIVRSEK